MTLMLITNPMDTTDIVKLFTIIIIFFDSHL